MGQALGCKEGPEGKERCRRMAGHGLNQICDPFKDTACLCFGAKAPARGAFVNDGGNEAVRLLFSSVAGAVFGIALML